MAFFVGFDLDETIGRFLAPYFHIFFLVPAVFYRLKPGLTPNSAPKATQDRLRLAFKLFIRCLAKYETSAKGPGLLRPGILMILGHLAQLKKQGRIKGILIYSNNGNLGCLYLASQLIEEILGVPGLFCGIIDRNHALRRGEGKNYITLENDESPIKSALVLREAFARSSCAGIQSIDDVPEENLIFFDDRIHDDLFEKLGPERYFKVNPYHGNIDLTIINSCFEMALQESNLKNDKDYYDLIEPILEEAGLDSTYDSILEYLARANSDYVAEEEHFEDDTIEILERLSSIIPPISIPNAESAGEIKGGRRRKRRKAQTKKKRNASLKRSTRKHPPKKLTRSAA